MSKIALKSSSSGTATFTIESPATNTDRVLTIPDAAGTVFVGGQALSATTGNFSGNVTLGSSVLETPTGSAPAYLCRAWVNFDGTTSPATIRGSGNVSSVTRVGTGDYQMNFTTAMSDANYVLTGSTKDDVGTNAGGIFTRSSQGTTSARILTCGTNGTLKNFDYVGVCVFR